MAIRDITGTDKAPAVKWETAGIDPNWVSGYWELDNGGIIVTFKEEFRAEVHRASQKMIQEQSEKLAEQVNTNVPKFQKEHLDYLKQHYNPRNMSREEYDDLIEDLVRFGVLTEQEKCYLNFTNGWILYPDSYGISPETFMDPPYEFENCERNAYELARYHSQVEWLVGNSHRRFQDAQALTFGKLLDVFNQMSAR